MSDRESPFSFRDNRRIDPMTGAVREPAVAPPGGSAGAVPDPAGPPAPSDGDLRVAELTADLQRLQAEYANYRKRVQRDQDLTRQLAVAGTLADFFPVLDDVERARAHGDLEGAFRSVGEALESTVARLGLQRFGEPGDPFDPAQHEAIAVTESADVREPSIGAVHQVGYRFAERVVRPAVVTVAEPPASAVGEAPPDATVEPLGATGGDADSVR